MACSSRSDAKTYSQRFMDTSQIIDELEDVARRLGLEVRTEKGNFRGGRCTVGDETIIMLNKRHLPEVQLAVLAESLREAPLDTVYLKPAVRRALEEVWAEQDQADAEADAPDADTPGDATASASGSASATSSSPAARTEEASSHA
jgi:hypothetical protein